MWTAAAVVQKRVGLNREEVVASLVVELQTCIESGTEVRKLKSCRVCDEVARRDFRRTVTWGTRLLLKMGGNGESGVLRKASPSRCRHTPATGGIFGLGLQSGWGGHAHDVSIRCTRTGGTISTGSIRPSWQMGHWRREEPVSFWSKSSTLESPGGSPGRGSGSKAGMVSSRRQRGSFSDRHRWLRKP